MLIRQLAVIVLLVLATSGPRAQGAENLAPAADFATLRAEMVRGIELEAALTASLTGIATIEPAILAAMGRVPRHAFVPPPLAPFAYGPQPLPVHPEQNLAAPYLVALMTQLAAVRPTMKVFETGTGEGYHAAVLAELGAEVWTQEVLADLARQAALNLREAGFGQVAVREADGYFGWPEAAPFDAIIVKEAVDHIPPPLLAQLRPGGRLVLPLGPTDGEQALTVVTKRADGSYREERVLPVRFSPLQGGERI